uniref:Palmitoyltransferase n=1 Tax=Ciona savignyi TaxID=51511 RepID=H2ZKS2_CIOSA
ISLILITVALFFGFECRLTLVTHLPFGFFIPIVCGLLFLFNMGCLLRTAWSDPGIIPRASPEENAYLERCLQDENTHEYRPPPRTLDITINGAPIKLKYCFTCKIFRPPRASHCSMCDNCVGESSSILRLNHTNRCPGHVLYILICFFSIWSVVGLSGFHSYLVGRSLTTNEDIKGTWSKKRNRDNQNPFDQGGLW